MEYRGEGNKLSAQDRDIRFDILRFIGLTCIVLAHVSAPNWLSQIRNFDVPLMIIISGAVYSFSSGVKSTYTKYLLKRINRLVIPTWIFLIIYFVLILAISLIKSSKYPYTLDTIISAFTLTNGFGYVWIVRIFLLTAIVSPWLFKFSSRVKSSTTYFIIIAVTYIVYELVFHMLGLTNNLFIRFILNNFIYVIVPYGCLTALGVRLPKMKHKSIISITIAFGAIFIGLVFLYYSNGFVQTQGYKYPPRLYYISYAVFLSLLLYVVCGSKLFQKVFNNKAVKFISYSSFWIYLWHILYLYIWQDINRVLPHFMRNFIFEFILVYAMACITTLLQRSVVKYILLKINRESRMHTILPGVFFG